MGPNAKAVKANGVAVVKETCFITSGGEGLLMYKRRKTSKLVRSRKISQDSVGQPSEKPVNSSQHLAMGPNAKAVKANGVAGGKETCSIKSSGEGLLTYKRRKSSKLVDSRKISQDSVGQPSEKNESHPPTIVISDCSPMHKRNFILEEIYQVLDTEDDLRKFDQSAVALHPGSGSRIKVEESVHYSEDCSKRTPRPGAFNGPQKESEGYSGESKPCTFKELCERTLSDIIMSEPFTKLCSLLQENFQGLKADKVVNLSRINSRMKENAYESSPMLLQSDIQEIWTHLQKVGSDITALAKYLSEKTQSSFSDQFPSQELVPTIKTEQAYAHAPEGAHTCRLCREAMDGSDILVCDSCESIYHVSCIVPPIKEIPTTTWYCADCTSVEPSHENCVVCRRLNITQGFSGSINPHENMRRMKGELVHFSRVKLEGSLNATSPARGGRRCTECKVCTNKITSEDEYKKCGHSLCPNAYYHARCLTSEQSISYGPCWYCPSCLCTACSTDRDDDKNVLCDGCDRACHTYCMDPPRDRVPKGKWFCGGCESGMARVREAKRAYGVSKRRRRLDGRLKRKEGGVDVLLIAADTMNCEEKSGCEGLKTVRC